MVPARFADSTYENFEIQEPKAEQRTLIERLREFTDGAGQKRRFWQRSSNSGDRRGIYLLGAPGVGKTHLLAASFSEAPEPKIYASFDELAAAVGSLGVHSLGNHLERQSFVAIDEITLDDPANIMLAVTLLHRIFEGDARVIATANIRPDSDESVRSATSTFSRELSTLAGAFELITVEGEDYRRANQSVSTRRKSSNGWVCLSAGWADLVKLLRDTHPMHDAWWLVQIDRVEIAGDIHPLSDSDDALRFVRFIDRVYDRDVELTFESQRMDTGALLPDLAKDPRFRWHAARCESRLAELLVNQLNG